MKIDVLVGGQFGSEAKGLMATHIAYNEEYDWLISVNSAQAGHTAPLFGTEKMIVNRQLPSACVNNHEAQILIAAGSIINPEVLVKEIKMLESHGIPILERLFINPHATVIMEEDVQEERDNGIQGRIGSTCEGVGVALSRRVARTGKVVKDVYTELVEKLGGQFKLQTRIPRGDIFLEGSQGYGLSTYAGYYPFCTSRDTTTAAFLSYAQLPPNKVRHVYGVFRTYPIRVGGNSGDMYNELTWEEVAKRAGYDNLCEITTVTKRVRRVGEWDAKLAMNAMIHCGITRPLLTFVNYLDSSIENVTEFADLPVAIRKKIFEMSDNLGEEFYAVSTNARNFLRV